MFNEVKNNAYIEQEIVGGYLRPLENSLETIFTDDVLGEWERTKQIPDYLKKRIDIIKARDLPFNNTEESIINLQNYGLKTAWESYIKAAYPCGLFQCNTGKNLISDLQSTESEQFRSAMAECMACWILACLLKLQVQPKPKGRNGRMLDMLIKLSDGDINVEVKTPFKHHYPFTHTAAGASDVFSRLLSKANKQFPENGRNILFIALTSFVFPLRYELLKAFYGELKLAFPVGGPISEIKESFIPDGEFIKNWSGSPHFTRVSGVVCAEEIRTAFRDVTHRVVVLHNPYAQNPIPQDIWNNYPQFIRKGEDWGWSDGCKIRDDNPRTEDSQ